MPKKTMLVPEKTQYDPFRSNTTALLLVSQPSLRENPGSSRTCFFCLLVEPVDFRWRLEGNLTPCH